MTQLVPPDGVEIPRVLEELDRRHVDLVEGRNVAGFTPRKTDRRANRLEESLHVRYRRAFGMLLNLRRLGMEPGVEPLDLFRIEDAVGLHEGDGFGVVGIRLVFIAGCLLVALGGAVVDDDGGFRTLDDLRFQFVRLPQRHPVGRCVSGHHGAHGQQEVVDALVGFAVLPERDGAAADRPGFAPGQHPPVDDFDEFIGDRRRSVELWFAAFFQDDLRCLGSVQTRRYRQENTLGGDGRVRPEPCQTPSPGLRIRQNPKPAFTFRGLRCRKLGDQVGPNRTLIRLLSFCGAAHQS